MTCNLTDYALQLKLLTKHISMQSCMIGEKVDPNLRLPKVQKKTFP